MIRRLFNLALVLLLAPALFAFVWEGVFYLLSVITFAAIMWFVLGIGLSVLIYVLLLHGRIGFIEHLLHELEHATLPVLLTFRFPSRMEIDPDQGSNVRISTAGGCLATLAPYYLPLLTLPFLVLKALAYVAFTVLKIPMPSALAAALDLLIGATFMFHFVCTLHEFRFYQPDIKTTGYIGSTIAVLFLNFMFLLLCVAVVTSSYPQLWETVKLALATTVEAYQASYEFLRTYLPPLAKNLFQFVLEVVCPHCTPTPAP
jgi:hypothetical protein